MIQFYLELIQYCVCVQDQRSTVISLQNLIVREVANEERGESFSSFFSLLYCICLVIFLSVLQSITCSS